MPKHNVNQPHNRWHWWSLATNLIFYAYFASYVWWPEWYWRGLGRSAWDIYLVILSFLALLALMSFFITVILNTNKYKPGFLVVNGSLVMGPLYFLWLTYIHHALLF